MKNNFLKFFFPVILILSLFIPTHILAAGITNPRLLGSDCTETKPDNFSDAKEVVIEYAGRDNAVYSNARAAKFQEIVFHDPGDNDCNGMERLVVLGQQVNARAACGGGSCGYHFYVGTNGRIVQGAPMNRRTNHMPYHNSQGVGITILCAGPKTNLPDAQVKAAIGLSEALRVGYSFNQVIPHNSAPREGIYMTSVVRSTPISGKKFLIHYKLGGGKNLYCKIEGEIPACTTNCDNSTLPTQNYTPNQSFNPNFSSPYQNSRGNYTGDSADWGYPIMRPTPAPPTPVTPAPINNLLNNALNPTSATTTTTQNLNNNSNSKCSESYIQTNKENYYKNLVVYNESYKNDFGEWQKMLNSTINPINIRQVIAKIYANNLYKIYINLKQCLPENTKKPL